MEAVIMMMASSSSSSSYLKLKVADDYLLGCKSLLIHPSNLSFSLSSSSSSCSPRARARARARGFRPLSSVSSSHAQQQPDLHHHQLLTQQHSSSPNGYPLEAAETQTQTQTVGVIFQLQRECSFGHNFLITGDHPILGLWDPNNALPLTWSDGHLWTLHLDIPVGICIKFKFILQETDGIFVWQPGPDRVLECFQTENIITLCEDWENPDSRIIIETYPTTNPDIQFVEPPVGTTVNQEPEVCAINMKEVLVSDETVPVLVPGLNQLPLNEGPDDEPEPVNGAAMVSTGADMAEAVPGLSQLSVNEGLEDEPEPVNGAIMASAGPDMVQVVPGLSQLPVNESPDDEPEPMNGAVMASAGPDMAEVVPSLSQLPVNEGPEDEPEPINAVTMTSAGPDMAEDPSLPELDLKGDNANTSNSNPRPEISSIQENEEMDVAEEEEEDHEATQPTISFPHNDIQWSNNVMQKFLNIFGIQ